MSRAVAAAGNVFRKATDAAGNIFKKAIAVTGGIFFQEFRRVRVYMDIFLDLQRLRGD